MDNIAITDVRANPGDSAFLVDDGKTAILYDTGFAFSGYDVAENIKRYLGERSLDYVFLTHSHYDHALGSVYVSEYWKDALVVASEYAAKIFTKPSARKLMRQLDSKFANACGVYEYKDLIDNLKADIIVKNGDKIQAGNMIFEVLELPGHTNCSVGYYCREHKLLLSCETIGVYNGLSDVIPSYLVGVKKTISSIDLLNSYDIDHILVPHYGVLSGDKVGEYLNKAKKRALSTANTIIAMHNEGYSKAHITQWFKNEFYNEDVKEIYPIDAMELNTGIMIDLVIKECAGDVIL